MILLSRAVVLLVAVCLLSLAGLLLPGLFAARGALRDAVVLVILFLVGIPSMLAGEHVLRVLRRWEDRRWAKELSDIKKELSDTK